MLAFSFTLFVCFFAIGLGHQSTVEKEEKNVVKEEKAAGQFGGFFGDNGFGDWDYNDYSRGRRSSSSSSSSSSSRSSSSSCSGSSESSECEEKKCPKPKSCPALSIGNNFIGTLQSSFGPVADGGRVFIRCSNGSVLRNNHGQVEKFELRCKDGKYQPRVSQKTLSELRCEVDTRCAAPNGFFKVNQTTVAPYPTKPLKFEFDLNNTEITSIGKQPRGTTIIVKCVEFPLADGITYKGSQISISPSSINPVGTIKPYIINYDDRPDRFTMTCDETGQWQVSILIKSPVVTGILSAKDSVVCEYVPA